MARRRQRSRGSRGSTARPSDSQPGQSQPQPRREPADAGPSEAPVNGGGANGGEPEPRTADGISEVRRLFQAAQNPPRWPMYIRQAKQFLRNVDSAFDERKFGFASLVDLLRACQREGLFRIERDRQGVMRVFPGNIMQGAAAPAGAAGQGLPGDDDNRGNVAEPVPVDDEADAEEWTPPPSAAGEVVEGAVVQENVTPEVIDGEAAFELNADQPAAEPAAPKGRGRARSKPAAGGRSAEPRASRKSADAAPKARKPAAKPRAPRTRARKDTPAL